MDETTNTTPAEAIEQQPTPAPEDGENGVREREERIERREAEIQRRELRAGAIDTLAERSLPRELEQFLDYSDAEACAQSIDRIERLFRSAVQRGVDERIRQNLAPLPGAGGSARGTMIDKMRRAAGLM